MPKTRDKTFDIMKGFLILMVIVGHTFAGTLSPIIFSFHMPLFFVIAGYFFKQRTFGEEIKLSIRRLLLPCFFSSIVIIVIASIQYCLCDINHIPEKILSVFWGGGQKTKSSFWGYYLWAGPLWFFYAMFCARLIFVWVIRIKDKLLTMCISIIASIFALNLNCYFDVPFSFLPGVCAISFMLAGNLIREKNYYRVIINCDRI